MSRLSALLSRETALAWGRGDQWIVVVPGTRMVVVATGAGTGAAIAGITGTRSASIAAKSSS